MLQSLPCRSGARPPLPGPHMCLPKDKGGTEDKAGAEGRGTGIGMGMGRGRGRGGMARARVGPR